MSFVTVKISQLGKEFRTGVYAFMVLAKRMVAGFFVLVCRRGRRGGGQ